MSTGQIGILAAIIVYLAAMVYVGFYFSKKGGGDSADEFYLGGRKLGALVTAMSAEASDMRLDRHWSGCWYISQLADCCQAPAPLFRSVRGHYHTGLFLPPLPG